MMAAMRLLASNGEATGHVDYRGKQPAGRCGKSEINKVRGGKITMIFQEPMTSLDPLYSIGSQLMEPIRRHRGLARRGGAGRRRSGCSTWCISRIPSGA